MVGKIFLAGGGDGKQSFDVDKIFLKDVRKILYLPIAWKNNNFEGCLEWFTGVMKQHKDLDITMMVDWRKSVDFLNYDAVYIGGGNTFQLLHRLREGGLDTTLSDFYRKGGSIYGGSAGAIIWGNRIDTASLGKDSDENMVGLKDTRGFDFVKGFDIQCHFEDDQIPEQLNYVRRTGRGVVAIPEESALVISGISYKVLGSRPITLFRGSKIERYTPDNNVKL